MSSVIWIDVHNVFSGCQKPALSVVVRRAMASLCNEYGGRVVYASKCLKLLVRGSDEKWHEELVVRVRRNTYNVIKDAPGTLGDRFEGLVCGRAGEATVCEARAALGRRVDRIGWSVRSGVWVVPEEHEGRLRELVADCRSWAKIHVAKSDDGPGMMRSVLRRVEEELAACKSAKSPSKADIARRKRLEREVDEMLRAVRALPSLQRAIQEEGEAADLAEACAFF